MEPTTIICGATAVVLTIPLAAYMWQWVRAEALAKDVDRLKVELADALRSIDHAQNEAELQGRRASEWFADFRTERLLKNRLAILVMRRDLRRRDFSYEFVIDEDCREELADKIATLEKERACAKGTEHCAQLGATAHLN